MTFREEEDGIWVLEMNTGDLAYVTTAICNQRRSLTSQVFADDEDLGTNLEAYYEDIVDPVTRLMKAAIKLAQKRRSAGEGMTPQTHVPRFRLVPNPEEEDG